MHILVLPSFYPDENNKNLGKFFKEQVETLAVYNNKVAVVYIERKSLKKISFRKIIKNYFQLERVEEYNWLEYRIKGWKIPGFIGDQVWLYLTKRTIKIYIKENGKPDIVHAHNTFLAGVAALNLFKKNQIEFLITEHDSGFLFENFSNKKKKVILQVYLKASHVVSVSKSLKKAMNLIAPKININIIPNIVNTDFFEPIIISSNTNEIKFLSIGNLTENKNHQLLIESFYEVSKQNNNLKLVICGDGPKKDNLNILIKKLKLTKKVEMKGFLDSKQILHELQSASCLVHTSDFETFGVVLIEAISCGLPFISTKSGGPEDVFEEGAGYLIEKNNLNELSRTILHFIDNKDEFNKNFLRSIAVNKYSREAVYEKLNGIYRDVNNKC